MTVQELVRLQDGSRAEVVGVGRDHMAGGLVDLTQLEGASDSVTNRAPGSPPPIRRITARREPSWTMRSTDMAWNQPSRLDFRQGRGLMNRRGK